MLSHFIQSERGRRRHLGTPFGPHLDGYLSHRQTHGFAATTIGANLKWITAFGEYVANAENGVTLADLGEPAVEAFVEYYRSHSRRCGPARRVPEGSTSLVEALRGSLCSLLRYLRGVEAVPPRVAGSSPSPPYEEVLVEYIAFLREHRGFAALTIEQHRRWSAAFLGSLASRCPSVELPALSCADAEATFIAVGRSLGRRSRQIMTATVESFIRFLRSVGHVPTTCVPFLPRMKTYALSSLPSVIPWSDVERALDGIGRTTSMGRRDAALVTLVAMYGLRAAEVVNLRLDDIDWRGGVIHVRQTKTRRVLDLPLLLPVRDALVAYLREARPEPAERRIFAKCHAPRGPISRAVLYGVVRKTLKVAGIEAAHYGPHALRHARATSLIRTGESLKVIGDLLGHRVPEATMVYCKVAVEDLRAVALELPEASS